jgi:hypothetical protein
MMTEPRLIAHVRVQDPPGGLTLAEWIVWRLAENQRMCIELQAQVEAFFERLDATLH